MIRLQSTIVVLLIASGTLGDLACACAPTVCLRQSDCSHEQGCVMGACLSPESTDTSGSDNESVASTSGPDTDTDTE